MADLIGATEHGLWCERGGFHIDPWRPVERAVVTHAHGDHACAGCGSYLASGPTCDLLRVRLGAQIEAQAVGYGERVRMGGVVVSLHPAGHILGSAQVRVEDTATGEVWVVSGDYKVDPDPTAEPFEVVRCDTFISETTFGLPIYRWPDRDMVAREINEWWRRQAEAGRTAVLLAYALGKAQRVLRLLDPAIGPIGVHGAIPALSAVYERHGVGLPKAVHATTETAKELKRGGAIVAPPSASATPWIRRFAGENGLRIAMVSGWMRVRGRRRWRSLDHGFCLSDHADFEQLVATVEATGASRVGLTHGSAEAFARYLAEVKGLETFVVPTRYVGEEMSDDAASDPAHESAG